LADNLDAKGMASIFTDPCRVNFRPDRSLECHTAEEVYGYYSTAMADTVASSHHVSNFEFHFDDPHTVRTTCALYSMQRYRGYPEVPERHRWARYEDTFVRTPDGWRQSELLYLVISERTADEPRLGELAGRPEWPHNYDYNSPSDGDG
jgi:hypothetical protein